MLSENLKQLRKQSGLSQEELAARLHVVRQTVSKWEKGLSVPDADLLVRLSEILDTPVSALLGQDLAGASGQDAVAEQLAGINEQLAARNRRSRRIWRALAAAVLVVVLAVALLFLFSFAG